MDKKQAKKKGFSLAEVLVIMSIVLILMSVGTQSFLGFRETALIRENVETLKQDILLAQHMAINTKRGEETKWIYGIGIDLSNLSTTGGYRYFRWVSQFDKFGDPRTKAPLPDWNVSDEIKHSYGVDEQCNACLPLPIGGPIVSGKSNLALVSGYDTNGLVSIADNIEVNNDVQYILFESVTGRALLYDKDGQPVNYSGTIENLQFESNLIEIVIKRKRSRKFDIISVYPSSGIILHHTYKDGEKIGTECDPTDTGCIVVNGSAYERYSLESEIKMYRKEP